MGRQATRIELTSEQQEILKRWMRSSTTEQRIVQRSRIILMVAEGMRTDEIADALNIRPATASKWRIRFAKDGLQGLQDTPRSGRKRKYDEEIERMILSKLDEPPYRRRDGMDSAADCAGVERCFDSPCLAGLP